MSNMVICSNDIPCIHKFYDHMEITTGMFTKAMDHLYNSFWFAGRYINPTLHLITVIKGMKTNFMKHTKHLQICKN